MTTKSGGEGIESPVRKRLRNRPSPRKSRAIPEMESPSTIFEKDEEMEAENDWSNHMSTEGVDQSIIELLNTTWDQERNQKKGRSARESTSHSTMTSCVSSFRERKGFPETKCMMSQSTPNGDRRPITKDTIKIKRPRSLKSKMLKTQTEADDRSKSQVNKSMIGSRCVHLSKSPSERVPTEFDVRNKKICKSIKTDDSIAKFLERQKRASSKSEEADQKNRTQSIGKNYVSKYLSPRPCGSRSETSIGSERFRSQAKNCSFDRLSTTISNKKLLRRHVSVKKDRRGNQDQRRTRTCSPSIDLEPLRPRRHKSKKKTSIGQGLKKNLQITETSTYAISMDKLISDQMLQLADSMQSVKSKMTNSKGSITERTTDLSLNKLRDPATNEISQSAQGARVDRETDHCSEGRSSRRDSCSLRSDRPVVLSCCSSGRIPDLVIVHRSSERLSTGRISSRSLRDSVRSNDTIERVDSSRRYSPSNDKVYNTLHSKSTSDRFRDKQVTGILEEELNDSLCPSADRFRYHLRESITAGGVRSYHRRSPSIEEMRDRIHSRSTVDRFINRTSDISNEVLSSKLRSSSTTDSSRFQRRTASISTEQLKAKLHSSLTPERLTECSTDICSTEQLKMIQNSKMLSKATSEEYASCPSNEQLKHKECLSSNLSECFKDSSFTSAEVQRERSVSHTSSGVRIKRGSHSSTKPSSTNTRSTSKSSKRQSRRTPSTSTEKLRKSLRSGSGTSYRPRKRQSPSPISAKSVDKQMFASRTSEGVTDEHASIISSEQLKTQLRISSSTTCQSNLSSEKPMPLMNCRSVSEKQIPCTLVDQSKSRGRSRIMSPRWTAENSTVDRVASAQIPPRPAMMKGTAKMSEGMISSKMANLNVLWSKDSADVGDGEEQRMRIREFLGIGCEHIDSALATTKPNVVIVKQRELGVQTHYAITDSIIPLDSQSRGQFAFEGPREKEIQTAASLEGLVAENEYQRLEPREPFKLRHSPSVIWNFSLLILSTVWSSILGPIFNLCLLILVRAIAPTLWITVGIAATMMVRHMADHYEHSHCRKPTIGSLRIVKDLEIIMNYLYQGVDYVFGEYLRISKPS